MHVCATTTGVLKAVILLHIISMLCIWLCGRYSKRITAGFLTCNRMPDAVGEFSEPGRTPGVLDSK